MDQNELSAGPAEADLFAKSEARPGHRENVALVSLVVLLGVAGVSLSFLLLPDFFDGDMAKNLVAEAVGASVIAGAVFILLRMQDRQRWKGAEAIAASRLSHWLTRMFLNASIPLLAGGARPVEFSDPEKRIGFTIHSGVTIESVRDQVLKALEVMRVPADDVAATTRVQKYFDSVEAEFGVGTWDIVQSRIHHDLEMISDTMSRFDTVLLRNLPLFERLADLEEIKSFMDGSSSPELIYHGFYGLVFRRAEAILEELSRLGYASRLRTHDLR